MRQFIGLTPAVSRVRVARIATFLSPLLLLIAACDKDGSGSAAEPGPVKYTTGAPAYAGAYDGTRAVAYTSGEMSIFVPRDCPTFSCADVKRGAKLDMDRLKTSCPSAQFMIVNVKPPTAPGRIQASSNGHAKGSDANGLLLDSSDVDVLSVSPKIVAHVNAKGSESVEGVIGATICPTK